MGTPLGAAPLDSERSISWSSLHVPALRGTQLHFITTALSLARAVKSHPCFRTSPLDFWNFHWSELFRRLLPMTEPIGAQTHPYP